LDTKTGEFSVYRTAQGMPNDAVFGIVPDNTHKLWISTNKGITRFDPNTAVFRNYSTEDGLQSDEFKLNAVCKAYDGTLYFGGNNGFNHFDPSSLYIVEYNPPLVLSALNIMNEPISVS